ncbi:MAG: preprotein translocase subunit SecA, partial [Pseudobdellovibrionaceae bacterium]
GDPGESKFYLSLEDNLMRIFNGERVQKIMNTFNIPDDEVITAGMVTRAIEGAQRKVEGHNFDVRKHLLEYDDVMNQQRTAIYKMRRQILEGKDLEQTFKDMMADVTSALLDTFVPEKAKPEDYDLNGLNTGLQQQFGLHIDFMEDERKDGEKIVKKVSDSVKMIYDRQVGALGQFFGQIQKMILLQSIDARWKEHLQYIDSLKEGIGLRGYAQKDPLIEYKKEAFNAFETLNRAIYGEAVEKLLKVQIVINDQNPLETPDMPLAHQNEFQYSGGEAPEQEGVFSQIERQPRAPQMPQAPQRNKMSYSRGDDGGDGEPKMNRADRRRMKKK